MCKEIKNLYVFRISYLDSWASSISNPVKIFEQHTIARETPKTYVTSRGVSIRKAKINNPMVGYGGVIEVITTQPYFNDDLYKIIRGLLVQQYEKLKKDIAMCELSLNRLPKFREGDIIA